MSNELAKNAVTLVALSGKAKTKKSQEETAAEDAAINFIVTNGVDKIQQANDDLYEGIRELCAEDQINELFNYLNSGDLTTPVLVKPTTPQTIEALMVELYTKTNAVMTLIEHHESAYKAAVKLLDTAEQRACGILAFAEKWKSEATFSLTVPSDVIELISNYEIAIRRLNTRKDSLEQSYQIVSRLVTVLDSGVKDWRTSRHD